MPAPSRRQLFEAGAATVAGTVIAPASALAMSGGNPEMVVRAYFKSWEKKDWGPFDTILADDFTFTSPNDDDHISKAAFKKKCWESQADFIKNFDIELLMVKGDQVFIKYLGHTQNGKGFRNVELHRVRGSKLVSIECFFGAPASFASAVGSTS